MIKLFIIRFLRIFLKFLYIFPLYKKRIVFESHNGKQYSCNPKYITEYINKTYKNRFEIIWIFENPNEFKKLSNKNIKLVRRNTLKYIYYILTCKIAVTNTNFSTLIPFRKEQIIINTWHGGGSYKRVGIYDNPQKNFLIKKQFAIQNNTISYFISSCKDFTVKTLRKSMLYDGKILEIGMPRNDILFTQNKQLYNKIKNKLKIDYNTKILLYAPTWRNDKKATEYDLDFQRLSLILEEKFKGNWLILVRLHHYVKFNYHAKNIKNIIDISNYDDMQELLYVSDILITDYSSSMWDFSLMYKPCFLYATDLNLYKQERDFYTDIHKWPFPLSENNDELIYNIENFDNDKYIMNVKQHHKDLGSFEDGHACEKIVKYICKKCDVEWKGNDL